MPLGDKNYYKILQVDPSADPEVIEAAYRRLARMYHPDTNRSADTTRRMQEINAAYEALKDPAKRAQHDRDLSSQSSQSDAKYAEEWRKREEAEAALRRAQEEVEDVRRRAEEERRRREEAEAALRRAKSEQQWRKQNDVEGYGEEYTEVGRAEKSSVTTWELTVPDSIIYTIIGLFLASVLVSVLLQVFSKGS